MKKRLGTFAGILAILLIISVGINITQVIANGNAEPGSEQDPLISKSYIDDTLGKQINDLRSKYDALVKENDQMSQRLSSQEQTIDALQKEVETLGGKGGNTVSQSFKAVSLQAGQALYAGLGSEVLLRSGKATAIKGKEGGLTDVTSAKELASGISVPANRLVISSAADGCGLKAVSKSSLLVRGSYKISTSTTTGSNSSSSTVKSTTKSGTIKVDVLNIREKPNTSAAILAKGIKGETVTILSTSGDWYQVKTAKGIQGWALGSYITVK